MLPDLDALDVPFSSTPSSPPRYGDIKKERFNSFTPAAAPTFIPKEVEGSKKDIRVSPWKLGLIARQIRGLTVPEARLQLQFSAKRKSTLVSSLLRKTSNLADIRHDLGPGELEVFKCYVTKGRTLKRVRFHARGKMGKKFHRHSHINVTLREVDFDARIAGSKGGERRRWERLRGEVEVEKERREEEDREVERIRGLIGE